VWEKVERGELNGYSVEALVRPQDAIVEITVAAHAWGFTEKNDGHEHSFFVVLDEVGRVIGGVTSKADDGHFHEIDFGTATEFASNGDQHAHRLFLP
jgi:hypothetical protein